MRRSRDSSNQVLSTPEGLHYGLYLAADYCGQHEWGIADLLHLFGVDESLPGIPGRTSTREPKNIVFLTKTTRLETAESKPGRRRYRTVEAQCLAVNSYDPEVLFKGELQRYPGQHAIDFIGGFDKSSFAVAAYSDAANAALNEIKTGIESDGLCIMMGGGNSNPFDRGGLVLARASLIPAEQQRVTFEADMEAKRLQEAAEATGIIAKLDAAPTSLYGRITTKRYHALKPAWVEPFKSLVGREGRPADDTKHPVIFFLNPTDQSGNNHGWFTVEELEQWLEGTGPIPKRKAA